MSIFDLSTFQQCLTIVYSELFFTLVINFNHVPLFTLFSFFFVLFHFYIKNTRNFNKNQKKKYGIPQSLTHINLMVVTSYIVQFQFFYGKGMGIVGMCLKLLHWANISLTCINCLKLYIYIYIYIYILLLEDLRENAHRRS